MWDKLRRDSELCEQYREALEDLHPGVDRVAGGAELRNSLPEEVTEHAQECEVCDEAAEIFWASRSLLSGSVAADTRREIELVEERAPWFATRVMARIAEREMEGRLAVTEWSRAVAKLAARLAWVSAAVLIVGSTWLYTPSANDNSSSAPTMQSAQEQGPQYLFDAGTATYTADDALVPPAER